MATHRLNPNHWVDKYSDYFFNYTMVRVNDREVTNDLISETFLAGLGSMQNFKGEASERTWLISILKRKIIDYYRRINSAKAKAEVKLTYREEEEEGDRLEEQIADLSNKNAEELIENEELRWTIYKCLKKLPEKQTEIFKMKTLEGKETDEICKEYNITASNLWVIIHRARTALANCLEKNWFQ